MKLFMDGKENHITAIKAKLDEVQNRCNARCLSYDGIRMTIWRVERELGAVPAKAMAGTKLHYNQAQRFPASYKNQPMSTHFTAVHNGRCWEITEIFRGVCPNRLKSATLELSETAKAAIIARCTEMEV